MHTTPHTCQFGPTGSDQADGPLPVLTVTSHNTPVLVLMERDDAPDRFDLDAPYQRGSVWEEDRQRALVRSLLLGVPTGAICVSELPYREGREADLRVIDGKQRIEAIRAWTGGRLAVPGSWFTRGMLTDREEARARMVTYADLTRPAQRHFENLTVPIIWFRCETEFIRDPDTNSIVERKERTEEQLLAAEAEVFGLINFGGVGQTADDRDRAAAVAGRTAG